MKSLTTPAIGLSSYIAAPKTKNSHLLSWLNVRIGLSSKVSENILKVCIMASLTLVLATSVQAQCNLMNEPFNTNPVLSPTNVDGAWYPDRYRPAAFVSDVLGGENVLKISIDGIADGALNRPGGQQGSFYNTQGRKFNQCGMCVTVLKGDLWIPNSWAASHRRSDMWATAFNGSNAISFYPIIGFRNVDGASPNLYYWDGTASVDLGPPGSYDEWYSFEIRLSGTNLEYLVDAVVVATIPSNGSEYFGNIIMQAYNFNDPAIPPPYTQSADSYDAYWDNLFTNGNAGANVVRNTDTNESFCSLQEAINDPQTLAGHTLQLEGDVTEGIITLNKALTIDGGGFTLTSTSANYGIEVSVAGAIITDLTVDRSVLHGGTFGIHVNCGADNLAITNTTVQNGGGTGFTINGSDNVVLTNITSTNNIGNGVSITNCDNLTINGITTSLNAFSPAFSAGIGLFTSSTFCLPAGINGFTLTGTVSIAEPVKVYSQKENAADVITGLSGASIEWAVGVGALDRGYWPDKATAFAAAAASFDPPYSIPNTVLYVVEIATENYFADDDPAGDATTPMLIQAAVTYLTPGKTIFLEDGIFNQRVSITKSLTLDGNGPANTSLDGFGLAAGASGVAISAGVTNVTVQDVSISTYTGTNPNSTAGIYAAGGNDGLTLQNIDVFNNPSCSGIYIEGNAGISDVLIDNVKSHGHGTGARGIVIWNGFKSDITITNCEVYANNCCGIELQDGTASGVTMSNNNVHDNADSGMSATGLTGPGANLVSSNTVTHNGRFGIEIKLPNGSGATSGPGSIVVQNNIVSRNGIPGLAEQRDMAGIAVFRRGYVVGYNNIDIPTGVVVQNNTVSMYNQPSSSDGFGIVIEGTNHTVTGNTLVSNNVGIQQQAGHVPYTENTNLDGDQSNLADTYFGRGNAPFSCGNTVSGNTFTTNTVDSRNVGAGVNTLAGVVRNTNTNETFCSIQKAIDDSNTAAGHTITANTGTYNEDVMVGKQLTISGDAAGGSIVSGPIGGAGGATFKINITGVILENFTITRAGNNTTDWNDPNLNSAGVAIQGQAITNAEIRNCIITGNRSGIDINNSNGHSIHNNTITNNHTGMIFRNQTDNTNLMENNITDNRTVGVLFLDASTGTNSPVQQALNSTFNNNNISGNWYGQIVDRQTGGSLPAPGTTNIKNFECNWYGNTAPVYSTANSAEPAYAMLIPVVFGGTATAPGGQPDICGPASANLDYIFYLIDGTDNDGMVAGFQPVPGACIGIPVGISIVANTPATCTGGPNNGSLTTMTVDGNAPFTYLWSNGETTADISGLAAGTYTVTVTDVYNSMATAAATVVYLPVTNATTSTGYPTIQDAINAASPGDEIQVCSGTYTEQLTVNKALIIKGIGTKPIINGTSTDRVVAVTAANVTLDNLNIQFNQGTVLHGIYAPTSGAFNNLSITNCKIEGTGTTGAPVFGSFGIRLGSFGGVVNDLVTLTGNEVLHSGTSPLGRGVRSYNVHGTWDNNALTAWYSIQGGDFAGGLLHITNNSLTGVCEVNNLDFAGIHTITGNTFAPSNAYGPGTDFAQIELKNLSRADAYLSIQDNNFVDYNNFGIFSGRANNVTVDDNVFTPLATAINYRSIRIDTKQRTTGVQGAFNSGMTLTNNTFNGNNAVGQAGIAIEIANSDNVSNFSAVTIGTASNENDFAADNAGFISLNNETGSTSGDPLWTGLYVSTKAKVTLDIDIENNNFDAGSGLELPSAMSIAGLYNLEDKIQHEVDDADLGFATANTNKAYVTPNSFVNPPNTTPSIQRAVNALTPSGTVHIQSGTTYTGGADLTGVGKDVALAPGSSPGCVTIAGNLVLNGGDVLGLELNGTVVCTEYDQLTVNGTVTLGGASLSLSLGFVPSNGDQFMLISNDSNDPVVGQFLEGYGITAGGVVFSINYAGGDGNDVVLTACGTGNVHNMTSGESFCRIQDAINDATAGDEINVDPGTYNENIVVTKSLTLNGAQADNACPRGGAESIIHSLGASGTIAINVQADDVTINGFTIKNPLGSFGVFAKGGTDDLDIRNNIITDIGNNTNGSSPTYGVAMDVTQGGANMTNVTILNNCVSNIRGGENTALMGAMGKANNGSGVGIGAGFSDANFDITGLTIDGNKISNITASTILFADGGKGAYGVLINVGAKVANTGKAVSPIITNNEITELEGLWAHGIGLEGETPGAVVKNNFVDDLTDHKGNTDAIGVLLEENDGATSVVVKNNSFTNMALAIKNLMTPTIDGTCNWYGTADAVTIATLISGNVTFSPYLSDGADGSGNTGFQPSGLCDGTPVVIVSATSTSSNFCGANGSIDVDFTGGTSPYTIEWAGPVSGGPVPATSIHTIGSLLTGMYTITVTDDNGSTATVSATVGSLPVKNLTGPTYYATIQAAIDAATAGDVLEVCAGNYTENINISKALTINGPNVGISGTGVRAAEAVLLNCFININNAGNTTLDGFHVKRTDGVTGPYPLAPLNQIELDGGGTNTVQNCIFERLGSNTGQEIRAIVTTTAGGPKVILNNKITGDATGGVFGGHKSWARGIYIDAGAFTVTFTGNTIENCRTAMNADDYNNNVSISGNTFNNNGTHISLGGVVPTVGSFVMGANDFINNPASTMINLSNVAESFRFDITSSSLNGTLFSALGNATLFEVESRMAHKEVTASKKGKVIYKAGNQYVNNFTVPVTKIDKIQNSIKYGDANDIINLEDGTYNEKLIVDKSNLTLQGVTTDKTLYIIDGMGLGVTSGIYLNGGVTNTTIKDLTVQKFTGTNGNTHAGIYGSAGNNNLTVTNVALLDNPTASGFYANGPIDNVSITNSMVVNNGGAARGIVIWNGLKTNITITGNMVTNNTCCGIELQDGDASAVTVSNNTIDIGGGDNAIGLVGLNPTVGANTVNSNIITGGGRFGIEIKNPAGGVTVSSNSVSLTTVNSDLRDRAGIAVFRRGVLSNNIDVPNGVTISDNTVTGYTQTLPEEGFGIVIEGTNHVVTGNDVTNCDIGIQEQGGAHANSFYPNITGPYGDGQGNGAQGVGLSPNYFGRGNAPFACGNTVGSNTFGSNGTDTRTVIMNSYGLVTNVTSSEYFCNIQAAINDAQTLDGHTLNVGTGTFNENVTLTKDLTINGAGPANTILTPTVACTGAGITISANNATVQNLKVTNFSTGLAVSSTGVLIDNVESVSNCNTGLDLGNGATNLSVQNSKFNNNTSTGFRKGTAAIVSGFTMNNSEAKGNVQGCFIAKNNGVGGTFDDVTITNSDFSDNTQKGMYFEALSNAMIDGIVINNSGTDAAYGFNNGIDINLKYSSYSNITIQNCDITNSGANGTATDPQNAAVIAVKARNDGSYSGNPATLTDVTIKNNLITGPQNGIRFGEIGVVNAGPSNVTVEGNDLSFAFANKALIRRTNNDVTVKCNWHGTTDLPTIQATFANAGTGNTVLSTVLSIGTDGSGAVGFQPSGVCDCPSGNLVTNTNTSETFCTIQAAIDDPQTLDNHTLEVSAGTYVENVIVSKSLTINGPNALIDACTGTRVAEAIIVPATAAISAGEIFHIAASDVTISGFTIDGDNTALTSGFTSTNGADIDAAEGVAVYEDNVNSLTVSNNIFQNLSYFGVSLFGASYSAPTTSGHVVNQNKFQNLGTYDALSGISFWGGGVLLYNDQYTSVTDNCMTNVRIGVQTGNFHDPNPSAPLYQVIDNNTIQARRRGIFYNLHTGNPAPWTLSNNNITALADANETVWDGILMASLSEAVGVATDNTIDGSGVNVPSEGYEVWNVKSNAPVDISGGSVSGVNTGVFVNNFEGYNSNAGDGAHAMIGNMNITPNAGGTGIRILDSPSSTNAAVSLAINAGVTITGGTNGLVVENANASVSGATLNDLVLTAQTGKYIQLISNAGDLDATAVSFDGQTGTSASFAQLFAIEDKIDHKIDNNNLGFVLVKADNAYVTDIAAAAPTNNDYTRIRNAVELVANNWSINLNGTFDWTEANAAASWALGNDDIAATGDDYSITVPVNLNGITFTAPEGLGNASIEGPGDLAAVNLEGVLLFDGGDNQNWTISNMDFQNFDMTIAMFNGAGGVDAFNGTTITNNHFLIPTDLNAVVAPADVNQNIGIHYSFGTNQTISNNVFDIPGDGISDGINYSSTVAMQSNTSGGAVYDGLLITGNTINVLNAPSANPQVILGYWENGHAHTSNITVSNNQFLNLDSGNDPSLNLQRGFRVTSHSGASSTVDYTGNTVQGANMGFQWITGSNFSAHMPVQMTNNILNGNNIGMLVQSNGKAVLSGNDFDDVTDNTTDIQIAADASVVTSLGGNQFAGDTYYVENLGSNGLNISADMFDLANDYRRADHIFDALDNPSSGLVRYDNNELYVSTPGTGIADETIPNAVSAAAATGDVINIETGTYASGADGSSKEVTFAPGSSPGCVTINGNMLLTSGDALEIELDGTVPCTGFDRFIVNGTVTLGGASLDLSLGFVPANGDEFIIIANDGVDVVVGQFAQGSGITVSGTVFSINYAGGDGNDVVLTACGAGYVHNMTSGESFCRIQDAINDATAGDVINVDAGTYNENIVVTKSLTLNGAQAGNACPRMGGESIIHSLGASGTIAINVQADDVTINGFTIKNPLGSFGVFAKGGTDDLDIRNNIITDIGNNNNGSSPTYGVSLDVSQGGANMTNVTVLNNCVSDIRGGENIALMGAAGKANNGSAVGIGAGFSNANFDITGLNINGNKISNIRASIIDFADGGKGAYGVLINVGANIAFTGKAVSPIVQNNEITDLEGLWAHGIGLEGETPGAMVKNNYINDLTDHKGDIDAIGVLLEENDGAATVVVNENSFTNMSFAIKNLMMPTIAATCNWYGTTDAVAIAAFLSGNITFSPYLTSGGDGVGTGFQPTGMCVGTPVVISSAIATDEICGVQGSIDVTFSGGTGPYDIAWSGGGSDVGIISPYTISSLPAGMYTITVTDANMSTATATATILYLPVTNFTQTLYYATIQAAVTAAAANDIIEVCKGTYTENIVVDKALTINGPQINTDADTRFAAFVSGVDGPKADPNIEAIITATINNPTSGNPNANDLIRVLADGVTINGFVIDGNNPDIAGVSGTLINSVEIDARRALTNLSGADVVVPVNNLDVRYNIIQNFGQRAVSLSSNVAMTGNLITENVIRNFKEQGVLLLNNAYVDLTNNTVEVPVDAIGLHLQNFNANGTMNWTSNDVTVDQDGFGIHANLFSAPTGMLHINNNIVNAASGVTGASDFTWGINVWSVQNGATVSVTDNTIGSTGGEFGRGINLWNLPTANTVTVSGGTVDNSVIGINLDNVDPFYGAGNNTTVAVTNTIVTGGTIGIRARTEVLPADPFFSANVVNGNTTLNLSGVTVTGAATNIAAVAPAGSSPFTAMVLVDNDSEVNDATATGVLVSGAQASATVQNNDASIHGNPIGIDVDGGSATVTNNHIYDNGIGVRFINGGTGDVNTNNFFDAMRNGKDIQAESTAGAVSATGDNWFAGTTFGVENLSPTTIDATLNYWNDASGPGGAGPGTGAAVSSMVDFCPWLNDAPVIFGGTPSIISSTVTIQVTETSGTADDDGTICVGDNVTLDATTAGATAYLWSPGGETTASISVSPAATTTYSVSVTVPGCLALDDQIITVDPLPSAVITADAVVCGNSTGNTASVPDAGVGATYVWSITNGSITAGTGTNQITYSANMSGTITFNVTVTSPSNCTQTGTVMTTIDMELPTITCVAPVSVNTDAGFCTAVVNGIAPASVMDNCPVTVTYAITGVTTGSGNTDASGTTFNAGVSTVTYTVTDAAGNTATCSFTVTVNDMEMPSITCPADVTLEILDPRDPYAIPPGVATGSDVCGPVTITYNDNRDGLTLCNATGNIVRTFTATDGSNNTKTCVQTVTIQDMTPPVLSNCPTDITVNTDPTLCTAEVAYTDPTAVDVGYRQEFENAAFVSGSNTNTPSTDWNDYNSALTWVPTGTNGITSSGGSGHGLINSVGLPANQTGVFNRLGGYHDEFGTGFRTSLDIYIDLSDPKVAANTYGWDLSSAASKQDASHLRDFIFHAGTSGGQVNISASNNSNVPNPQILPGSYVIPSTGWYTFEWVFRDDAGALAVDLNLKDAGGMVQWTKTLSNPADLIASVVGGNRYMWFTFITPDNLAIDNSLLERNATVVCAAPSGSVFPLGMSTVTCTATDACNNMSTCAFSVTVIDNQPPVIVCPTDIVVVNDLDECNAVVNYTAPVGTDNCTGQSTAQTDVTGLSSGSAFPVGVTTLEYTVTDAALLTSACTFTVTVNDTEMPSITCPADVTVGILDPRDPYDVTVGVATGMDNCGAVTITYDDDRAGLDECNATGDILRTFTATDASNNTKTCTQTITVVDLTPPVISPCPADIVVDVDAGLCTAVVNYTDPTAVDVGYQQGFENAAFVSGSATNAPSTDWNNYNSLLTRVPTGTNGIASSGGSGHGLINSVGLPANQTGAFNRLGGYHDEFGTGFRTSLDIYIDLSDPKVAANTYGWDLSSAASKQDVSHLRDFIFHAGTSGGQVNISASNNSNVPNPQILPGSYVIPSTGWYTFEWVFRDDAGALAVDLNLKDAGGMVQWTKTLSNPADLINTVVGGNRYMWFTFITPDNLAIDNSLLERNATVVCAAPSGSVFPLGMSTVTCTATDACNNMSTCNFTVTVNPTVVPAVSIAASSNPICAGVNVTFTPTPTDGGASPTYEWFLNNVSVATGPTYSSSSLANGDMVYAVMTSNYPCPVTTTATSNTVTMTVNPLPVGDNTNTTACSGSAVNYDLQNNINTLGNSVNSNFSWLALSNNPQVTGESLSAQTGDLISDVLINLTNTPQFVIYRVTPTSDPEGCEGSFFDIFVTINPTPDANATGNGPQCTGLSTDITVTNPNNVAGTTYNWSAPMTAGITELGSAIGANNVALSTHIMQTLTNTTNAPIVVTFTITPVGPAPSFCTGTVITRDVTVNPTPAGAITVDNSSVCNGDPVMLTFTATAGTGLFTIVVNGISYPNVTSGVPFVTLNPTMNTTYTLENIMDANGCSNPSPGSSVMVTINPNANAGIVSGTTPLCIGATDTYTSDGDIGGTWSSTNMAVATVDPMSGLVTALAPGTTDITYTVNSGCASPVSAFKTLTVSANLNAGMISGTSPLCSGAMETYTSSGDAGGTWSSTNMAVATVDPMSGLVTAVAPGMTDITYTISTGCGSPVSAFKTLTVSPNAAAGMVSGTSPLCNGEMTTFVSSGDVGGTWSSTNLAVATVDPMSGVVTTVGAGSTDITYTVNSGCGSPVSAFQTLTVNALPTAIISGPTMACEGGPEPDITFTGADGALEYTFTYTINGGSDQMVTTSGSNSVTVPVPTGSAGIFTYELVSVSDGNGCSQAQSGSVEVTITVCTAITGKLIWEGDRLTTMTGVNGADVNLTGDATDTDVTGIPGTYSVTAGMGSNFIVTPVKNRPMPHAINGLTAADASRIQQHVTGAFPITDPYKIIAADVNSTNSVTAQDVSLVTQAVLGNPIAQLLFINKTWRFVPAAYVFPNPLVPWGFPESITLPGSASDQDFIGLKLGDVNNTANPVNKPGGTSPNLIWKAQDQLLVKDASFVVEFRAENYDELLALQFGLKFNTAQIQFEAIEAVAGSPIQPGNFGLYNISSGEIRAMLALVQPISVGNGTPVFRIRFKAMQAGLKLSDVLKLNHNVLQGEAYLADYTAGPVSLEYDDLSTANNDLDLVTVYNLMQNRPNPFTDATAIGFTLPGDCEAQIRIFEATGRLISDQKAWYPAGYNEMKFQLNGYAGQGVLYYELTTPYGVLSKKMVLVRE